MSNIFAERVRLQFGMEMQNVFNRHYFLADEFDENQQFVGWNADGIFFSAAQETASHLFRIDPVTSRIARLTASSPAPSPSPATANAWRW